MFCSEAECEMYSAICGEDHRAELATDLSLLDVLLVRL